MSYAQVSEKRDEIKHEKQLILMKNLISKVRTLKFVLQAKQI